MLRTSVEGEDGWLTREIDVGSHSGDVIHENYLGLKLALVLSIRTGRDMQYRDAARR